jgi:hypothetical protein
MRRPRVVVGGGGLTVDEALRRGIDLTDDGRTGPIHQRVVELLFFDDTRDLGLRPAARDQLRRWDQQAA